MNPRHTHYPNPQPPPVRSPPNPQVGFLVNNVGASYEHAEYLADVPAEKLQQLINMNMVTTTMLCHAVLPQMAERSAGAIVNVSSGMGAYPCGLYAVYSASKAYVDVLSQSLAQARPATPRWHFVLPSSTRLFAQEYNAKGVTVQSLMPHLVVSKLSKVRKASLTCPHPEDYVASALKTVGSASRTTGYAPQEAVAWLASLLPESLVAAVLWRAHASIRQRALAKKGKGGRARGRDRSPSPK